jgi:hypothetical protein
LKVQRFLASLLGAPPDPQRAFAAVMGERGHAAAIDFLFQGIVHNTAKSGALLAAQGMFAVVGTYAMEHGWPVALILPAMILLLSGALLAMTILRSTMGSYQPGADQDAVVAQMLALVAARMIRFNLALYMTFVSVILLLVATIIQAR